MTKPNKGTGRQARLVGIFFLILGTALLFSVPHPFSLSLTGTGQAWAQSAKRGPGKSAKITYQGGPGDTMKTAVVIKGAANSIDGIAAEYHYLKKKYGRENQDWQLIRKTTFQKEDNYFDRLEIELKNHSKKTIFFNITEFFGKL